MSTFQLTFQVKNSTYVAAVEQTETAYKVQLQDEVSVEELVLELQSDGDFLISMQHSVQLEVLVGIAGALKAHIQDGVVRPALW